MQCVGKKRYATHDFALNIAKLLGEKYGKEHRAYSCGICGGYHCTTKTKEQK